MEGESRHNDIACVIFAGGKSSRMGRDKALLPFGGFDTLTEFQYQKFKPYFDNIYISTKERDKFNFDADFIEDVPFYDKDSGELIFSPAVAMYSVFEKIGADKIFAVSVDTPFFDIEHFNKLKSADNEAFDIIASRNRNDIQPLCSIYKKSCKDELLKMIEQDVHKIRILTKNLNTFYVDFNEDKAFLNMNNPQDYKEGLKELAK